MMTRFTHGIQPLQTNNSCLRESKGWEGGGKPPQVKTQSHKLPTDGPDHATRLKGHHCSQEFQANTIQLARSTGANVLVMVLQGCKSTLQKSRPLESGYMGDMACA